MSYHYSDESREELTYSLPDVETFYVSAEDFLNADEGSWQAERMQEVRQGAANETDYPGTIDESVKEAAKDEAGWYYWFCFPGYLPEGDPIGPFQSEEQALDDARDDH